MKTIFVFFEQLLKPCLIVALVKRILHTVMHRFCVALKIAQSCCLIVTLVTRIFHTIMHGFLVDLKTVLSCCVILTANPSNTTFQLPSQTIQSPCQILLFIHSVRYNFSPIPIPITFSSYSFGFIPKSSFQRKKKIG